MKKLICTMTLAALLCGALQSLRQELLLWYRCLLRQVMFLRSIHVQASICQEFNYEFSTV